MLMAPGAESSLTTWLQISSLTSHLKMWKCHIPLQRKLKQNSTLWKRWSENTGNDNPRHWSIFSKWYYWKFSVLQKAKKITKIFKSRPWTSILAIPLVKTHLFSVERLIQKPLWDVKILQSCVKISFTLLIWSFWFTTLLIPKSSQF